MEDLLEKESFNKILNYNLEEFRILKAIYTLLQLKD